MLTKKLMFDNKIVRNFIGGFLLLQFLVVGLIAVGVASTSWLWLLLSIFVAAFIYLQIEDSIKLFILSIPFFIMSPFVGQVQVPIWRPLLIFLFTVMIVKIVWGYGVKGGILGAIKNAYNYLLTYEKLLVVFFFLAICSVLWSRFGSHAISQIIFLINAGILYLIVRISVNENNFKHYLKAFKVSLLIIIALGFLQYTLSLFASPYYFWQYWATLVSSTYYGQYLGNVLTYSNSWFSADGAGNSLRMFGILQDTHAFAVMGIFAISLWISVATKLPPQENIKSFFKQQSWKWWIGLVLLCFAIIASGTRGVWVAMFVPTLVALYLIFTNRQKIIGYAQIIVTALIILLFIISPYITMGLNYLRTINSDDNFLSRASSIYDLDESSNAGRIEMWKNSVSYGLRHPLGAGYGNFITSISDNVSDYNQVAEVNNKKYNLPQKYITAHSLYLQILVELGWAGIILFGLIGLNFFWNVWLALSDANKISSLNKWILANLSFAVLWVLAYGFFDVTILNERVLLYLFAILAIMPYLLTNNVILKKN